MKFGFRTPSLKKRISARTSLKRIVRHNLGVKMPKGMGIVSNPKKAIYNKIYNKASIDPLKIAKKGSGCMGVFIVIFFTGIILTLLFYVL